ncbi:hypothetical protein QPK87_24720 [Kamptonema cortianum]|uniref:Uncharacterized protein n=1 Tax=Geitlerinema calcuttense NRMC-F 0142 TaxID=2922238 RepID=A0ABT7LV92_9CYAN|nr:hypothetical protein [Geitlerinema calcuttense]MDK3159738.1 hypothetical protein [Kamptonema cortianum]MDL5055961.1 hypothetical protein [Geitlerinema calcuttense NRMC-F 0142]
MKLLTIDTKSNCYVIDSNEMNHLQQNVASSFTLEKGTFDIKIASGRYGFAESKTEGEPLVVLWIYGVDGITFINKNTGFETGATWATLNGYNEKLQLEVKEKAVLCALFFDVNNTDNQGSVDLLITSNKPFFNPQTLTVDSKKNCYVLDQQNISSLKQLNSNFVELKPGNYKIKIRESNATYWSSEEKFQLEPWALLWIKDGKFVSNFTGLEVEETWCSLNGLQDEFILEVKEKITILGFFFDTYKEDNQGQVVLEINSVSKAVVEEGYEKLPEQPVTSGVNEGNVTVVSTGSGSSSGGTGFATSGGGASFSGSSSGGTGFATSGGGASFSGSSSGGASFSSENDVSFTFNQEQMERMWQELAPRFESSITITDQKDENKQAYWEGLEKSILKGYQSQAKQLAMQVARLEFMMKTLIQQTEVNFNQSFQGWSGYFNKNLNDLFITRIPRIVNDQVHLAITEQTQEIKSLVIQQIQTELNERVESVVNLKITNQAQEIKASVIQQMQTELEQRIENVVNVKIANQAQEINTSVISQISTDIDQRIDNAVQLKIDNQSQQIVNQVIQQIQNDIDQRVDNVVTLKISDQTQNVKNLVIQQMQTYIDQRIDNVVNLKIANQAQEINTSVVHQIQSSIDQRIEAVVNLKIANHTPNIKSQVVQQIEADFDQRIKSVVNQSTGNSVQLVVNNVTNELDNRINVSLDNKIVNFRNEVSTLVKNEVNQNFTESLKTTILSDIKKQQFYVDMQSIKAEVENFYARLGQFESQLYFRIEQGDTQLYNWTLEQLIALQGCLTDRQALVEMFEFFASNLKDQLNGAECVSPTRFTPWVRRTSQAQLESMQSQQLPNA